jgi:hypothetical protein
VFTIVLCMALAVVAAPALAALYLARLPYAPECPCCRAVTTPPQGRGVLDRLGLLAAATPVRSCARCGWAGRMRWKLAPQRAASRHS